MKNILVVSTTGMGDCLWATPGIRSLNKSFPSLAIDLLIQPQWESLYFKNPHVRRIILYQPQWYHQLTLYPRLLMKHYDQVLVFHGNKDIGRLIRFLRYSKILAHQNLPNIPDHQILKFSKTTHPILRREAMLKKIGAKSDGIQMEIFLDEKDRAEALFFLNQKKMNPKEFIYFNIGASLPHKQWPRDKVISLVKLFLEKTTLGIVLGGGPADKQTIEKVENQLNSKRVTHSFHRSLRANCALINQACLMITTDTGPMHIAFATKIPTIALFGPTRPEDSGPCQIGSNLCQIIQSKALDNMHISAKVGEDVYFDSITVAMVWDKVNFLLK